MATTKRESTLGKEKRGTSLPNSSITTHGGQRRSSPASTEKQLPNYLKPTLSSRTDIAINNFKKPVSEDNSQRANLLRRRSFDRPPSAARVHKALISPVRQNPTALRSSASISLKSTAAPKATSERVSRKPYAGKPQTLPSSRSMNKKVHPTTKKGSSSSASRKPPTSPDKKEAAAAQNLETKYENEETLSHQVEEVVKDEQGEMDDCDIAKADKNDHSDVMEITEVISTVEEGQGKDTPDDIASVLQEHNMPQTEEMEDKFHEEKPDDEDKENVSKEDINVDHDHQEKIIPLEEAKPEPEDEAAEDNATGEVIATNEIGEEKQVESREENGEGSQLPRLESSNEEDQKVEGEVEESDQTGTKNVAAKSEEQAGQGRKESPTAYNDVIEETASKLLEERKNKVRALVGAFETVIDKETSNAK